MRILLCTPIGPINQINSPPPPVHFPPLPTPDHYFELLLAPHLIRFHPLSCASTIFHSLSSFLIRFHICTLFIYPLHLLLWLLFSFNSPQSDSYANYPSSTWIHSSLAISCHPLPFNYLNLSSFWRVHRVSQNVLSLFPSTYAVWPDEFLQQFVFWTMSQRLNNVLNLWICLSCNLWTCMWPMCTK